MMIRDIKKVWQESYDGDIEDGVLETHAEVNADEAVIDYLASLVYDAMNILREKEDV